jgi:hypothetical protein
MGALRGLTSRERQQIKKMRIEKGYEAAIEAAVALRK